MLAKLKAAWLSLSPAVRRQTEAIAWAVGTAAGEVVWEAFDHGTIERHTFVLAAGAGAIAFKAALRNLPRDAWVSPPVPTVSPVPTVVK